MAENFNAEMIRGHIDTFILLSLKDEDKDTNEIRSYIESKSENKYSVKQGTFYSAMQRLAKQNYIKEYRSSASDGIRRKFFSLTEKGKKFLDKNINKWDESKSLIDEMIDAPVVKKEKPREIAEKPYDEFDYMKDIVSKSENDFEIDTNFEDTSVLDNIEKEVLSDLMTELNKETEDDAIVKPEKITDNTEENINNYEIPIKETVAENNVAQEEFDFEALRFEEQKTTVNDEKVEPLFESEKEPEREPEEVKTNYKEVLNKLFAKTLKTERQTPTPINKEPIYSLNENEEKFTPDEIINTPREQVSAIGNEIDFGDLYAMASREGFKIRTSQSTNKRSGNRILINKLRSDASLLFYALLFIEMIIMKISFGSALNWDVSAQIALPIVLFILPLSMLIARFADSKATVSEVKRFGEAMEIALLVAFQILIIIFAVALFSSVDFNDGSQIINYIVIPIILDINVPIYVIIKYTLLSYGKYLDKQ